MEFDKFINTLKEIDGLLEAGLLIDNGLGLKDDMNVQEYNQIKANISKLEEGPIKISFNKLFEIIDKNEGEIAAVARLKQTISAYKILNKDNIPQGNLGQLEDLNVEFSKEIERLQGIKQGEQNVKEIEEKLRQEKKSLEEITSAIKKDEKKFEADKTKGTTSVQGKAKALEGKLDLKKAQGQGKTPANAKTTAAQPKQPSNQPTKTQEQINFEELVKKTTASIGDGKVDDSITQIKKLQPQLSGQIMLIKKNIENGNTEKAYNELRNLVESYETINNVKFPELKQGIDNMIEGLKKPKVKPAVTEESSPEKVAKEKEYFNNLIALQELIRKNIHDKLKTHVTLLNIDPDIIKYMKCKEQIQTFLESEGSESRQGYFNTLTESLERGDKKAAQDNIEKIVQAYKTASPSPELQALRAQVQVASDQQQQQSVQPKTQAKEPTTQMEKALKQTKGMKSLKLLKFVRAVSNKMHIDPLTRFIDKRINKKQGKQNGAVKQ